MNELIDIEDPHQWHNRWEDPACAGLRSDVVADFYDSLPTQVRTLEVAAPA